METPVLFKTVLSPAFQPRSGFWQLWTPQKVLTVLHFFTFEPLRFCYFPWVSKNHSSRLHSKHFSPSSQVWGLVNAHFCFTRLCSASECLFVTLIRWISFAIFSILTLAASSSFSPKFAAIFALRSKHSTGETCARKVYVDLWCHGNVKSRRVPCLQVRIHLVWLPIWLSLWVSTQTLIAVSFGTLERDGV